MFRIFKLIFFFLIVSPMVNPFSKLLNCRKESELLGVSLSLEILFEIRPLIDFYVNYAISSIFLKYNKKFMDQFPIYLHIQQFQFMITDSPNSRNPPFPSSNSSNNLETQNNILKSQLQTISEMLKKSDEKYQKSLRQMSNIIRANRNLKLQLEEARNNPDNAQSKALFEQQKYYEQKISDMAEQKKQLLTQNLSLRRKLQSVSAEEEAEQIRELRSRIEMLKEQNKKLKASENSLERKTDEEMEKRLFELRNMNESLVLQLSMTEKQKNYLEKENQVYKSKTEAEYYAKESQKVSFESLEGQILQLRKHNAELIDQIQKIQFKPHPQSDADLLQTLKELHSEIEPLRYELAQMKRQQEISAEKQQKQKSELEMKFIKKEEEMKLLRTQKEELEERSSYLMKELKGKVSEKKVIEQLENQKKILEGKVIVYQTMEMVAKNRQGDGYLERVKQFEQRMSILLKDDRHGDKVKNAHVHQLVSMKAYVMEMDEKIEKLKIENEYYQKKYRSYKEKYAEMLNENKKLSNHHYEIVQAFKGKITSYERLVEKLARELEKSLQGKDESPMYSSSFNHVLQLYEKKIKNMYMEITELKKDINVQHAQHFEEKNILYAKIEEYEEIKLENEKLQKKLRENQMKDFSTNEESYKEVLALKNKAILELEQEVNDAKKTMETEIQRQTQLYKRKVARLQAELVQTKLQKSEHKATDLVIQNQNEAISQLNSQLISMEKKLSSHSAHEQQSETIRKLQNQNKLLKEELWQKNNKSSSFLLKDSQNLKLYDRIKQLQLLNNNLEEEVRNLRQNEKGNIEERERQVIALSERIKEYMKNETKMYDEIIRLENYSIEMKKNEQAISLQLSIKNSKIAQLQNKIESLEKDKDSPIRIRVIQSSERKLQEEVKEKQSIINHQSKIIQALNSQNQIIIADIQEKKKTILELKAERNLPDEQAHRFNKNMIDFENKIFALEKQLRDRQYILRENNDLRYSIEQLQRINKEYFKEIEEKREKINALQFSRNQPLEVEKIKALQNQINTLSSLINELKAKQGSEEEELLLKNEISRLHLLIHDKERKIQFYESQTRRITYEIERLTKINQELEEDKAQLKFNSMNFNDKEKRNNELLSTVVLLSAQADALRNTNKMLQERVKQERQKRIMALRHSAHSSQANTVVNYDIIRQLEEAHRLCYQPEEGNQKFVERSTYQDQYSYGSLSLGRTESYNQPFSPSKIQRGQPHHFENLAQLGSLESLQYSAVSNEDELRRGNSVPYPHYKQK